MGWLKARVARSPKVAHMVGQALFSIGGLLLLLGLVCRAALFIINTARVQAKMQPLDGLHAAYPTYPLWFVPEHPVGYVLSALVAVLGICIAVTAKTLLKSLRGTARGRQH